MRIAIAGSSGLIGQALLPMLQTTGHEAIPLVRRPPKAGEVQWDPSRGRLDPKDLAGIDGAINLAGATIATRWTDESKRRIRESRINGTTLLAETMAALSPGPRVLISVSAVGFYGDRGDEVLTEDSAAGHGFLPALALDWEASARPATAAGIRVVTPRLGIVLSEKGGALRQMLPPFKLGVAGRLGSGQQWMSWIAIDDVVGAMLHLLGNESLRGPVNLTAPTPVRNSEFTKQLGKALHRPTLFPVPTTLLQVLYGREMPEEALLGSARVVPRRLLDAGFQFRFSEIAAAFRHILHAGD